MAADRHGNHRWACGTGARGLIRRQTCGCRAPRSRAAAPKGATTLSVPLSGAGKRRAGPVPVAVRQCQSAKSPADGQLPSRAPFAQVSHQCLGRPRLAGGFRRLRAGADADAAHAPSAPMPSCATAIPISIWRRSGRLKVSAAYLRQFTELKGYQTPQTEAPPFLIGRWALYDRADAGRRRLCAADLPRRHRDPGRQYPHRAPQARELCGALPDPGQQCAGRARERRRRSSSCPSATARTSITSRSGCRAARRRATATSANKRRARLDRQDNQLRASATAGCQFGRPAAVSARCTLSLRHRRSRSIKRTRAIEAATRRGAETQGPAAAGMPRAQTHTGGGSRGKPPPAKLRAED